jgi:hypothetical protein
VERSKKLASRENIFDGENGIGLPWLRKYWAVIELASLHETSVFAKSQVDTGSCRIDLPFTEKMLLEDTFNFG